MSAFIATYSDPRTVDLDDDETKPLCLVVKLDERGNGTDEPRVWKSRSAASRFVNQLRRQHPKVKYNVVEIG